jgi:serine protease Do
MGMKRHHKIILGGFSTLIVISLIIIAILLNGVILKQNLENAALDQKISRLQNDTNGKINELATGLIETRQSLNSELVGINQNLNTTNAKLSELKAQAGSDFSEVIKEDLGSIVIIRTLNEQGSGFFVANGYVATNEHVIAGQNSNVSQVIQVITSDNKIHTGTLVGYIKDLDLALIKTDTGYGYLTLQNSSEVNIGEKVVAIGTPEGLSFSATDGIVSAVGRTIQGTIGTYVQTNAQLNPGNSGGPLIDQNGEVIGMNNFKLNNSEGIGFALESDKIKLGVNTISEELMNKTLIN